MADLQGRRLPHHCWRQHRRVRPHRDPSRCRRPAIRFRTGDGLRIITEPHSPTSPHVTTPAAERPPRFSAPGLKTQRGALALHCRCQRASVPHRPSSFFLGSENNKTSKKKATTRDSVRADAGWPIRYTGAFSLFLSLFLSLRILFSYVVPYAFSPLFLWLILLAAYCVLILPSMSLRVAGSIPRISLL